MSRISREARAVGTVPVALDTNPFATREDHGGGVVLVADLDAMVKEIRALLADSPRLQRLATEAAVSARTQAAWGAFCSRVAAAFTHVSERPGRPHGYAIGAVGAHVHGRLETTRIEHDAAVAARLEHISHLESRIAQLENESEALRARLRSAEAATAAYQARRVVRLADALSPGRLTSVRVSRAGRAATPPDSALSTTPSWSAAGPARATEPDSDRPGDDLVAG
jgi:hypothetical protein